MKNFLILVGCAGALVHFNSGEPEPRLDRDFVGQSFTQVGESSITDRGGRSVRFGLDFKADGQVDQIANGEKAGPTMSYEVEGKVMTITHACGTKQVRIESDGHLYDHAFNFYYAPD